MSLPAWIERVREDAPAEYRHLLDGVVLPLEHPDRVLPKVLARWLRRLPQTPVRDGVLALLDRCAAGEIVTEDEWNAAARSARAAWAATVETRAAAAALAVEAATWAAQAATWAKRPAYWAAGAGVSWADILGDLRDELTSEVAS